MRYVKRLRERPKPKCSHCHLPCDVPICDDCAESQADAAAEDARDDIYDRTERALREKYARELALCWRQATSWQGEARHQLERVLAELDPAWMTLV